MKRIAPIAAIAAAVTVIISLGFGAPVKRWEAFIWLAVVIAFAAATALERRANERNRETIERLNGVIRNQAELLGRILMENNGGRD